MLKTVVRKGLTKGTLSEDLKELRGARPVARDTPSQTEVLRKVCLVCSRNCVKAGGWCREAEVR